MAYDPANTYATTADVTSRVGDVGWLQLVDLDGDGTEDAAETTAAENEIEAANNILDGHLQQDMDPDTARGSGNDWLRDRCVDVAVYRIATMGGRDASDGIHESKNDAMAMLAEVRRQKMKVPRLDYPGTKDDTRHVRGTPRAINVGTGRTRSKWRKSRKR